MGNTFDIGPSIPTDVLARAGVGFETWSNALASVTKKSTVILWLLGTVLFSMQESNSLDGFPTLLTLVGML